MIRLDQMNPDVKKNIVLALILFEGDGFHTCPEARNGKKNSERGEKAGTLTTVTKFRWRKSQQCEIDSL